MALVGLRSVISSPSAGRQCKISPRIPLTTSLGHPTECDAHSRAANFAKIPHFPLNGYWGTILKFTPDWNWMQKRERERERRSPQSQFRQSSFQPLKCGPRESVLGRLQVKRAPLTKHPRYQSSRFWHVSNSTAHVHHHFHLLIIPH